MVGTANVWPLAEKLQPPGDGKGKFESYVQAGFATSDRVQYDIRSLPVSEM